MVGVITDGDKELLDRLPRSLRAANGVPEPERATALERAAALASEALADLLLEGGVRTSPLGPGWSRDIDLYLRAWPEPERLEGLGWFRLDPLMRRLGDEEGGMWAVAEDGRVLACLDLHLGSPPDLVEALVGRCARRGEVRAREVLEARALLRAGLDLPDDPAIRAAAGVEAGLGGRALARWRGALSLPAPARLPARFGRRFASGVRSALRPRLIVAVSGVDGSGKSTLIDLVTENLERAGVPVGYVWARPGSLKSKGLEGLARVAKRLLRQDSSWGSVRVAKGASAGDLSSRRGVVGWTWTMLVALRFVADVRWQQMRGGGVLMCARYLLDALVHLGFSYEGVNLRLHRAVVRRGLPKPLLAVYLDVPAEVALARKPEEPGDLYSGEYVVRRQLEGYEANRGEVEGLRRLDANRPAEELAAVVPRWLAET